MKRKDYQGIIFDMDNTLLQSKIDFKGMKQAVFELLSEHKFLSQGFNCSVYTTSQLIEIARRSGRMTGEMEALVWERVVSFEKKGMEDVMLEPGVNEVLEELKKLYRLVVLTNNAREAAKVALQQTGIDHYFEHIVGREQMTALKPSPSGVNYVLNHYPYIPAAKWLLVGDSWIDGKAAQEGNVAFLAYQGNEAELEQKQVFPEGFLTDIRQMLQYL